MRTFITLALLFAASHVSARMPQVWQFDVHLDERPIGTHRYEVTDRDGDIEVLTQASFNVKVLFVTVYRYEHRNEERWSDGCLRSLRATTQDGGDHLQTQGSHVAEGFRVVSTSNEETLESSCVMSFAYWNQDFLQQQRLLNAQTGEFEPVTVQFSGTSTLDTPAGPQEAKAYDVLVEDAPIRVWYAQGSGLWLALETVVDGRTLRYRPTELPAI